MINVKQFLRTALAKYEKERDVRELFEACPVCLKTSCIEHTGSDCNSWTISTNDISREGLLFKTQVEHILDKFCKDENLTSILFSCEFEEEQRKEIHIAAHRFGLKSKTSKSGDKRSLRITRKAMNNKLTQ